MREITDATDLDLWIAGKYNNRRWSKATKSIRNARNQAHKKAKKYDVEDTLHSVDILRLYNAAGWRCIYSGMRCYPGRPISRIDNMSLEHIIPMSKGGGNTIMNIIPASAVLNNYRCSLALEEWLPMIGLTFEELAHRHKMLLKRWLRYTHDGLLGRLPDMRQKKQIQMAQRVVLYHGYEYLLEKAKNKVV